MNNSIALQQVSKSTVAAIDPRLTSNCGAILLDDFIVAIDAGMRPFAARIFRETLEETYQRPVKYVCVTHYHQDHVFGLSPFKDVTLFGSAQIAENLRKSPDWSPQALERRKKDDPTAAEWLDAVEFIIPSVLFHQRMEILNQDKVIEFVHSGGHSSCSVYGYYPDEKILFSGDLIFAGMFPFAGDKTCDPEKWIATLKKWLKMDIDHVIPGHGPVTGLDEVRRQLEFLEVLKQNTLKAITAGKNYADIDLPAVYPVTEHARWFADKTQRQWYKFYLKNQ